MSSTRNPRNNSRRIAVAEVKQQRRLTLRKLLLASGGALAVTLTVSMLLLLNQTFSVTGWSIQTTGNSHTNLEQQMDDAMKSVAQYDFWSTRPSVLRQHLLASVSDLENVDIKRTLNGSLQLHGIARTPVGLWQQDDGAIYLVDMHGIAYRALQQSEAADLPILRLAKSDVREACNLLRSMQSAQPSHFSRISELLADESSWRINFSQGQQWMIARNEHISYSINKVSDLLAKPRWRSGNWRVDARATTRWFIRPSKQEGVI